MKFLLFTSLLANASAILRGPGRGIRRRLPDDNETKGGRNKDSSSSSSSSDEDGCDVLKFMFFADRTFPEEYKKLSYPADATPQPGDTEFVHFPVYDYEAFAEDESEVLIGYGVESLFYVPFADFPGTSECIGTWGFTFSTPGGDVEGQLFSDFNCGLGFTQTVITGGLGKYKCASGYMESVFTSPEFSDGVEGFAVWKIVNCGGCARGY